MSSLRESLQEIYEAQGRLTPALVVEEARDPGHSLHSRFEWDDAVAGEEWRRDQAQQMIRSVKVTYRRSETNERIEIRQWISFGSPDGGFSYEPLERVAEDPLLKKLALRDAERQWQDLFQRFGHLQEWVQLVEKDLEKAG